MSDRLSDSRVPWVLCVSVMLDFPRPGKPSPKTQSEITSRKREAGWGGGLGGFPHTSVSTQACIHCLPQTWTDHFININK